MEEEANGFATTTIESQTILLSYTILNKLYNSIGGIVKP